MPWVLSAQPRQPWSQQATLVCAHNSRGRSSPTNMESVVALRQKRSRSSTAFSEASRTHWRQKLRITTLLSTRHWPRRSPLAWTRRHSSRETSLPRIRQVHLFSSSNNAAIYKAVLQMDTRLEIKVQIAIGNMERGKVNNAGFSSQRSCTALRKTVIIMSHKITLTRPVTSATFKRASTGSKRKRKDSA